jgi:hypothetical protein
MSKYTEYREIAEKMDIFYRANSKGGSGNRIVNIRFNPVGDSL